MATTTLIVILGIAVILVAIGVIANVISFILISKTLSRLENRISYLEFRERRRGI